jgi:hypothetical protein
MHEAKITKEERNVDVVIKHLNTKQLRDRMVLGERDFFETDLFVKKSSKLLKYCTLTPWLPQYNCARSRILFGGFFLSNRKPGILDSRFGRFLYIQRRIFHQRGRINNETRTIACLLHVSHDRISTILQYLQRLKCSIGKRTKDLL